MWWNICFQKIEGVNLKVFNMMKEIDESKTRINYILCECRCEFDGSKRSSRQI